MNSLLVAGLCAAALALGGGLLTEVGAWYHALRKPRWQPPDWLFGPAWTVILALAAWSASLGWNTASDSRGRTVVVALFAANAVLHFLWSPLFFKLRRPDWALAEAVLLWISILAPMLWLLQTSPLASALLLPYLLWVSFAIVLNRAIVRLNGPFATASLSRSGAR